MTGYRTARGGRGIHANHAIMRWGTGLAALVVHRHADALLRGTSEGRRTLGGEAAGVEWFDGGHTFWFHQRRSVRE